MTSIPDSRSAAVRSSVSSGPVEEVRIQAKVSAAKGRELVPAMAALGVEVSAFSADPGLWKTKVALTARGPREAVDRLVSTLGKGIQVLDRAELTPPSGGVWSERSVEGCAFTFTNDEQRGLFELPLDALASTAIASRDPHGPSERERDSSVALVFKLIEDLGPKLRAAAAQSEDLARRPDSSATARFFAATGCSSTPTPSSARRRRCATCSPPAATQRPQTSLRENRQPPLPGTAAFFFRPENGAIAAGASAAFEDARAKGAPALGRMVDLASSAVGEAASAKDAKTLGRLADWALRLAGSAWESDRPALEKLLGEPLDETLSSAGHKRALLDDGHDANLRLLGEGLFQAAHLEAFDAGASAPAARLRAVAVEALRARARLERSPQRAQLEKAATRLETFGTL